MLANASLINNCVSSIKAGIPADARCGPGVLVSLDSGRIVSSLNLLRACVPPPLANERVPTHVFVVNQCIDAILAGMPADRGHGVYVSMDSGVLMGALDLITQTVNNCPN